MTTDLDDVLQRVAAGELSPDEALALLDPPAVAPTPEPGGGPTSAATARFYGFDPSAADGVPAVDDAFADLNQELQDDLQDDLRGDLAWPPPDAATGLPAAPVAPGAPIVQLRTSYRRIHVVADPAVAELFVTGAHTLRRDGA